MLCIDNIRTEPYFNIAAEEYFLKNSEENIFMLYRNEPSVIIGKHQNVQVEVNTKFAEDHRIKIVRRFSGGGAVYHDLGNINLTFIESGTNLNFDRFTNAMIDMLSYLAGVDAKADARRGLTISGYKISGSAQGVYKNRVMYHATLLFSSDLASLTSSLEGDELFISDKKVRKLSVRSVKSPVTNVVEHLDSRIAIDEFSKQILNYFMTKSEGNSLHQFSEKDIIEIENLTNNKYSTHEWNYEAFVPGSKNKAELSTVRL